MEKYPRARSQTLQASVSTLRVHDSMIRTSIFWLWEVFKVASEQATRLD